MPWNKILCATDFSEGARAALELAVRVANENDAELVIAHVWSPPSFFVGETVGLPATVMADLATTGQDQLAAWGEDATALGAKRVSTLLLSGQPWFEVTRAVETDPSIELIVIGTHGRTGITRALLGSVAERIVRHTPVPVLVIPQNKA